jgi:hypothetical protein
MHQSNCGVSTAGNCTIERRTWLRRWRSSQRSDSVNPRIACFAPQYADCSGIARYASADPTCTITPRSRGSMCASAAIVPYTAPRYVTSVTRRNSAGVMSTTSANTVAIATFTHASIGPSFASTSLAARRTAS